MADNPQAKFSVVLDDKVSDAANSAADSMEALRDRITGGESALKEMNASLRRLRGNTVEVKQAQEQLKARIGATKDAVSAASLAMLKQGASAEKLAEKTKLATEGAKRSTEGMLSMKTAALGVVGVVATMLAAVTAAGVGLAAFIVKSADAARSMKLMREAANGGASNAEALGNQVDALARKVATPTAALNDLAVSLAKGGLQGQTLVDTLNAVGQANAALGDDAGAKLQEIVERSKVSQRMFVNPLELQGSGLQFDDIAKSLADSMHVGVGKAREALLSGRVKLGDGAAAMRKAIETKFGDLNLRKMMSLGGLAETLRKRLAGLTKGVNLEPALRATSKLLELFDDTTVTGSTLKGLVTVFGNGLVKTLEMGAPLAKSLFQGMVIGALEVSVAALRLTNFLLETFGNPKLLKDVDTLQMAFDAGKFALVTMAGAAALLGAAVTVALAPFAALIACFTILPALGAAAGRSIRETFLETDWPATGAAIVDGILDGLKSGARRLVQGVKDLADKVKGTFTGKLEIKSPSKVFARYGRNTVEGFEQGIESRAPKAAAALDSMVSKPSSEAATGGRGAAQVTVNLTLNVNSSGGDVAKQLSDQSILAPLLKAIEGALIRAGIPVTAI